MTQRVRNKFAPAVLRILAWLLDIAQPAGERRADPPHRDSAPRHPFAWVTPNAHVQKNALKSRVMVPWLRGPSQRRRHFPFEFAECKLRAGLHEINRRCSRRLRLKK